MLALPQGPVQLWDGMVLRPGIEWNQMVLSFKVCSEEDLTPLIMVVNYTGENFS